MDFAGLPTPSVSRSPLSLHRVGIPAGIVKTGWFIFQPFNKLFHFPGLQQCLDGIVFLFKLFFSEDRMDLDMADAMQFDDLPILATS